MPPRNKNCVTVLQEGVTAVQQVKQWQSDILETLQRLEKLTEVGPENTSRERND